MPKPDVEYEMMMEVFKLEKKEGTSAALSRISPWLNNLAWRGWRVVPGQLEYSFTNVRELWVQVLMERDKS